MELLTGKPINSECDLKIMRRWLPSICGALDNRLILNFLQRNLAFQLVVLAKKCVADETCLESVLEELEEIYDVMLKSDNCGIRVSGLSVGIHSSKSL